MRTDLPEVYQAPQPAAWTAALDVFAQRATQGDRAAPGGGSGTGFRLDPRRWQEQVNDTFCDLEVSPRRKDNFSAYLKEFDRGELKIVLIVADAQTVTRTVSAIKRAPAELFFLNMNIAGRSAVVNASGQSQIGPGEAVLMDAMQPYQLQYPGPVRTICVQFPQQWLRQIAGVNVDAAIARRICTMSGAPRVLSAAIQSLIEDRPALIGDGPHDEAPDLSIDLFLNVLGVGLRSLDRTSGTPAVGSGTRMRLGRLQQFLADSFRDPEIRPASAAQALGWSVRSVHKVCQDSGTTFGKILLNARLSAVALELSARGLDRGRVSDLAFDAGFTDLSHFCRTFKTRYGLAPGDYAKRFC